ncbi:MAG TPA: hypothetical protein PL072_01450 [Phycisphaerales bacterium]|nr:hypothetical protein [Phycisphaerales bacterium]
MNGTVYSAAVLHDGTVAVTGGFYLAGAFDCAGMARFDPRTGRWSALGTGARPSVGTSGKLALLPSGEPLLAASRTISGHTYNLWRLDAATDQWLPFADAEFSEPSSSGGTQSSTPKDIVVLPSGDVVVSGTFQLINGMPISKVARWDGAAWHDMSAGLSAAPNQVLSDGLDGVVAVGLFQDGPAFSAVAAWSSQTNTWSLLANPGIDTRGLRAVAFDNGDLLVGGYYSSRFAFYRRADAEWKILDDRMSSGFPIARLPDGRVLASGYYRATGEPTSFRLASFDPLFMTWSPLGGAFSSTTSYPTTISSVALLPDRRMLAGGIFGTIGGRVRKNIAIFDGSDWRATNTGVDGPVTNLLALPDGDVIAAGVFKTAGDFTTPGIARWRPETNEWFAMPGITNWGSDPFKSFALARAADGDILFAGALRFPVNSTSGYAIVRWDQGIQAWRSLGTANGFTFALLPLPKGDVIAAGSFSQIDGHALPAIARWRSSTAKWEPMGGLSGGPVYALALSSTGVIYAGGSFTSATGSPSAKYIARWDEVTSSWQPVDPPLNGPVFTFTQLPGDRVLVQGSFYLSGALPLRSIAILDLLTQAWQPVSVSAEAQTGIYQTDCLSAAFPDGRAITAPSSWTSTNIPVFELDAHANEWTRIPGPVGTTPGIYATPGVRAVAAARNGDVIIGGRFTIADGQPTFCLARLVSRPPCSSDFDCSGQVAVDDLVSFLTAWFGQYGIADGALSADFNKDLYVGVDDLFAYIDAWMSQFAQCP